MQWTNAFEAYVAPARARNRIWRLLLGIAVAVLVYLAWMLGFGLVAWRLLGDAAMAGALAGLAAGGTPVTLIVLLFSFFGMALGAAIAARLVHGRPVGSLFGPARMVVRDFLRIAVLSAAVFGAGLLLWPGFGDLVRAIDPGLWLQLLPFALLGLLVQTGAEEVLFRGYLQQQLAARFRSALVWALLPSIAFGFLHYDPATMGGNAWAIVLATGLFGLAAADLTARTGSLGAAWGLHFVNNLFALLIVTMGGGLDGMALYRMPEFDPTGPELLPLLMLDLVLLAVVWGLARKWLRRA